MNNNQSEHSIRTEGLTRSFGELSAVQGLDLLVPEKSVFGFLGPNGAGKTTTIRMLLGLVRPDSGKIHLLGHTVESGKSRELMSRVGAMVESPSIYGHLTGRENLEVTRRLLGLPKSRIDQVLEIAGLTRASTRRAGHYSTGMRQRLGLAQALMQEPELLILDEPTNGLDPAGILEFRELIRRLPLEYGVTVFLSSHLLHEVEQVATHVAILRQGRMLFQGSLEQLKSRTTKELSIRVDRPEDARRLLETHYECFRRADDLISLNVTEEAEVARINAVLVRHGLEVFHLMLASQTLESIFFDTTESEERVDR